MQILLLTPSRSIRLFCVSRSDQKRSRKDKDLPVSFLLLFLPGMLLCNCLSIIVHSIYNKGLRVGVRYYLNDKHRHTQYTVLISRTSAALFSRVESTSLVLVLPQLLVSLNLQVPFKQHITQLVSFRQNNPRSRVIKAVYRTTPTTSDPSLCISEDVPSIIQGSTFTVAKYHLNTAKFRLKIQRSSLRWKSRASLSSGRSTAVCVCAAVRASDIHQEARICCPKMRIWNSAGIRSI